MNTEEITYNELTIKTDQTEIKDNKLYVIAVGLTPEFVPAEVIERDGWTFDNKEVRFRHKLPEEDVTALIGHIHETWVENEELSFLFEIWGHRKDLEDIQEKIINNEYQVSSGYKKTYDNNGIITEIYGREISVTPIPKCTKEQGCGVTAVASANGNQAIVMNEKNVDIKMAENEKIIILENENKRLVQHNKERKEMIESLESTIETLEEKVVIQNKTITEQNEKISTLEDENKALKEDKKDYSTLDVRTKIAVLEGKTDKDGKQKRIDALKDIYNEAQLTDMLESLENGIKHSSKSGRKAPVIRDDTEGLEENEDDNLSDEEFALKHFPNLKAQIKN